jgi:putative hydrolase of the HAD superfamily
MITDILFDLGNVLVPVRWDKAYVRIAPFLPESMAELLRTDRRAFEQRISSLCVELETGRVTFTQFFRSVVDSLGARMAEDRFHRIWCDIFEVDYEMVALGRLISQRYRTWLLSNTSEAHYKWILDRFPGIAFYQAAALSYELGVMKPSPLYFAEALRRFGIEPSQAVFIDDLAENVEGAVRAGIHGIVYRGRTDLIRSLKQLDVVVSEDME